MNTEASEEKAEGPLTLSLVQMGMGPEARRRMVQVEKSDTRTELYLALGATEGWGLELLRRLVFLHNGAALPEKLSLGEMGLRDGDMLMFALLEHEVPGLDLDWMDEELEQGMDHGDLSPFLEAVKDNEIKKVRTMLEENPELINEREQNGIAPLGLGTLYADVEMVKLLLEFKADVRNQLPVHGGELNLLHLVVNNPSHSASLVPLLAGLGVNPNALSEFEETPLLAACMSAWEPSVQALLEAGADPNLELPSGATALSWSAAKSTPAVVKLLLDHGAQPDLGGEVGSPLCSAVESQNPETVRLLLGAGADPNLVSKEGSSPLILASIFGSAEISRLLLSAGADVDMQLQDGTCALLIASIDGSVELAEALLDAGASIKCHDNEGTSALAIAALRSPGVAKLLLARGADPNFSGSERGTPALLAALSAKDPGAVLPLLESKADVNAKHPESGLVPLAFAVSMHPEFAGPLLRAGADAKWADEGGSNLLWLAARAAPADVIRQLVEAGCDVDSRDGSTPLIMAAGFGNMGAVRALLELKADPKVKAGEHSALDLARISGHTEIEKLFERIKLED